MRSVDGKSEHGWPTREDAESAQQEVGFEGVFSTDGTYGLAESAGEFEGGKADAGQVVSLDCAPARS
jgi:hypothetical protein